MTRVIGIGASAGGLEALEQLFGSLPGTTGFAFVIIQHLSPDFKSLMTELLSRRTKMAIKRVDEPEEIKPNNVYLIPPKKLLEIRGNQIIPIDFDHQSSPPRAIDHFFLSLAQTMGKASVGIVLSGTGSDGTAGASAIRDEGGLVIVQDPETCKFDGMPSSVIRRGLAQHVFSPENMAKHLASLSGTGSDEDEKANIFAEKRHLLQELLGLLEEHDGIDFKDYRTTTLARRVERRMQNGNYSSLESYIDFARRDADEREELQNEFLIGVTRFFRDDGAFEELGARVIPEIVDRNEGQPIRIWVAGCSTGEEAVSIAILFADYIQVRAKHCEVKIFATDVDRRAIEYASIAKYTEQQVGDLPLESKRNHFNKVGDLYELRPHIRRMIIYSHHNVVKDPPFTKLDLLSCRNLLIYFQPQLQERCISLFLFAIKNSGFLFLGKSEALGDRAADFEVVSSSHKIFRKHSEVTHSVLGDVRQPTAPLHALVSRSTNSNSGLAFGRGALSRESQINRAYEVLLNEYVPPCLLMDDKDQLIHVFGSAGELLRFPSGKTTLDVMKLLPKEFSLALRSASTLAASSQSDVALTDIETSSMHPEGVLEKYTVRVKPLEWRDGRSGRPMLVFFDKQESASPAATIPQEESSQIVEYHWNEQTQEHIQSLEDHLKSTRETLQTAIEELETTNEELQSTNEELMSSNEELQSSNEELHSVNEELYTVNTEYQNKIEELSRANLDIDLLLKTSRIGVIFLGPDLKVRRFNDNVREMIGLMPHDVGRPITDLQFNYANREIMDCVQKVSLNGNMMQFEMPNRGGTQLVTISHYTSQADGPYVNSHSPSDHMTGIVISFVDITPSKIGEVIRQKYAFTESASNQLLSEIKRVVHTDREDEALSLDELRAKLLLVSQMVESSIERRRIAQNSERTELISSDEIARKILDLVPGAEVISIKGSLPEIVAQPAIFEDTMQIIISSMVRFGRERKVKLRLESNYLMNSCCFDFSCKAADLSTLNLKNLYTTVKSPLRSEPELAADLGSARMAAELLGGSLELTRAIDDDTEKVLRLSLPGISDPIAGPGANVFARSDSPRRLP